LLHWGEPGETLSAGVQFLLADPMFLLAGSVIGLVSD